MNIHIESVSYELNSKQHLQVKQHVELLFSRVNELIDSIHITLTEVQSARGGANKQCTVVIKGKLPVPIVIRDVKINNQLAVNTALKRASNAFMRQWNRKHLFSSSSKQYLI